MTEIEAIKELHGIRPRGGIIPQKRAEAIDVAINALEKQIPMKPINITKVKDGNKYVGLIGKCPCCNDIVDEINIVCDCGQKLDWRKKNE